MLFGREERRGVEREFGSGLGHMPRFAASLVK
jgi:hypothetical protein